MDKKSGTMKKSSCAFKDSFNSYLKNEDLRRTFSNIQKSKKHRCRNLKSEQRTRSFSRQDNDK